MTTVDTGRHAEEVAANFLARKGCRIAARNWRTRWCEIDVVALRDGVAYFCEVKYRLQASQGRGAEYITARKIRQMEFAAEFWVAANDWPGEYQLCAIEVGGPDYRITGVFKDLT